MGSITTGMIMESIPWSIYSAAMDATMKGAGGRKDGARKKGVSKSTKAGLQFPVGRMARYLKKGRYAQRVQFTNYYLKKAFYLKAGLQFTNYYWMMLKRLHVKVSLEEDILRAARIVLPTANHAISVTRELFSGDPSMTLKVVPFLLIGAEYGHLITL